MSKSHPRWRLAKKLLTWLFFIAMIVLLVVYAKKVDWKARRRSYGRKMKRRCEVQLSSLGLSSGCCL